ncbi:hypothetical protein EDD16DRAFT_833373 [Pisolithus croceorrhizus]|nr:hypothetical protein EDD16DRAFT_833373 [Pisolithus croceorrhizus]KAI6164255.1 hypothetical protein EDD17DRAFT_383648 [Pisolithus thermaeus]
MHAKVVNHKSYTLAYALGPEQDPKRNEPVPSDSQCDEIGDTKPLPSPTGSSPANRACTHAPGTIASCFESFEGMDSVDHHALSRDVLVDITPYVEDSGYKADPYVWCPRMLCLHLSADGTRCLQVITCATVSAHFATHGVQQKSRREDILCRWEGCFLSQKRHNFTRHVREAHLGHRRGTAVHSSRRDGG